MSSKMLFKKLGFVNPVPIVQFLDYDFSILSFVVLLAPQILFLQLLFIFCSIFLIIETIKSAQSH